MLTVVLILNSYLCIPSSIYATSPLFTRLCLRIAQKMQKSWKKNYIRGLICINRVIIKLSHGLHKFSRIRPPQYKRLLQGIYLKKYANP